jgi:hypothetical protein
MTILVIVIDEYVFFFHALECSISNRDAAQRRALGLESLCSAAIEAA